MVEIESEVSEIFDVSVKEPEIEVQETEAKESEAAKETTEEDNYMELYVEKELKDKIDPLQD